jgi:hypothetical protein
MSIVAIIGGRDFNDIAYYKRCLVDFTKIHGRITKIISGKADGTDTLAWVFATKFGIPIEEFPAEWELYGKKAGFMRNKDIVQASNHVLAFWDQYSKGTKSSIDLAEQYNKELTVYTYTNLLPKYKIWYKNKEEILKIF